MCQTQQLCGRYSNVYYVEDKEACINCIHSEFDPFTKETFCTFQTHRIEAKRKMNVDARSKEQTKL